MGTGYWPKRRLQLTPQEEDLKAQICREFQGWGYRGLLGWVQSLGHRMLERLSRHPVAGSQGVRSLDLGCGGGHHFRFVGEGRHYGLDKDMGMLDRARVNFPGSGFVVGDACALPFKEESFDRIVCVYVLEHMHHLPNCLAEIQRILKPGGELLVGLPAEGGLAYEWGRHLTSKRHFEAKYGVDYLRLVRSEHCNTCQEVVTEVSDCFSIQAIRYLPFRVPTVHVNAVVALRCVKLTPEAHP